MTDLYIAMITMAAVCLIAGLGVGASRALVKGQRSMLVIALSLVGLIYFLFYGSGQLFWATLIPHSAAIIYSNLSPIFAALAAGAAIRLPNVPPSRRVVLSGVLTCASLATIGWPLLSIAFRPPPIGAGVWKGPVAMQTSWATCSPAAAATLLRAEGIDVDERDMIPLCLTDRAGTPTLGLYRGVKLVANDAGQTVQILDEDLDQLIERNDWPVLIAVELPYGAEDPRYVNEWGWIPGLGHSVVVLGVDTLPSGEDAFIIADPSVGLEAWTRQDMEVLWHGVGMRVE